MAGAALGCAGASLEAGAQTPEAPAPPASDDQQQLADAEFGRRIEALTRAQDWQGALDALGARPDLAERPDVIRLRASLLHQLGRSTEALAVLERRLTVAPDDALARFQLAEIHFDARHDQAARLAYRLALSGELEPRRRQVAEIRLAEIQERRDWRLWAGASVAPDSNINSATDASRVDLFGLPFELNDEARRQSGVSLSAFGGIERRFALTQGISARASVIGSFTDSPGASFDTASLGLRLGPDFTIGLAEVSVQATAGQRWYGGDKLDERAGLLAAADFGSQRTRWSGAVYAETIDDKLSDERDGWQASIDAARTHYLTPSSLWRMSLSLVRREAEAEPESYTQVRASAGWLMPMPWSMAVYVEPFVSQRRHDGAAIAFGVVREDIESGIAARFSKRDWTVLGAFPFIAASLSQSESTVAIGDFSRQRLEFGLTREF